jgi:hypothetical protein
MLTRRLFLIGSSSFVAAATIPLIPAGPVLELPPDVTQAVLSPMPYRAVLDLMLSFEPPPEQRSENRPCYIRMFGDDSEQPFYDFGMGTWSTHRWTALPGGERHIDEDRGGLKIDVWPDPGLDLRIGMIYRGRNVPSEPGRLYHEELVWRSGVLQQKFEPVLMNLNPAEDYDGDIDPNPDANYDEVSPYEYED